MANVRLPEGALGQVGSPASSAADAEGVGGNTYRHTWTEIELDTPTATHLAALSGTRHPFSPPERIPENEAAPETHHPPIPADADGTADSEPKAAPSCGPTAPSLEETAEPASEAEQVSSCCRVSLNPFEDQLASQLHSPHQFSPQQRPAFPATTVATASDASPPWRKRFAKTGHFEPPVCKPPPPWWTALLRGHPLHVLNGTRAIILLPLILSLSLASLLGSDWRHVALAYTQTPRDLKSRTLLSLSAVERITETRASTLPAAASVRELPMPYSYVRKTKATSGEMWCDTQAQAEAAERLLGNMSAKEAIGWQQGEGLARGGRMAVYHLLHGATFRDIDCRKMRTFENVGVAVQALLSLTIVFLLLEWFIVVLHLVSPRRREDATAALHFVCERELSHGRRHRRCESDPGLQNRPTEHVGSPPFLQPSALLPSVTAPSVSVPIQPAREASWAQIDVDPPWATRRSASARGCCPNILQRASRVNSVHLLGDRRRWYSGWSEYLWWRPVTELQRVTGWSPKQGRSLYWMVSFLEGTTSLLSLLQLSLLITAALVWYTRTALPACLNEATQLTVCEMGQSFTILIVATVFLLANFYLHLASAKICSKMAQAHASSIQTRDNITGV